MPDARVRRCWPPCRRPGGRAETQRSHGIAHRRCAKDADRPRARPASTTAIRHHAAYDALPSSRASLGTAKRRPAPRRHAASPPWVRGDAHALKAMGRGIRPAHRVT
ncbi:hypothetical protein XAPC_3303 [Xanthomonas citri pv. punicae str. LMG 859]|nr:hypothetical protein XAPC_3303 [Xanthomonas citri pv. punicae str. LMG 859]